MNYTIIVGSIAPVTLSSIGVTDVNWTVVICIAIASAVTSFLHYRFKLSSRITAAEIKAKRRHYYSGYGISGTISYPRRVDIFGHLMFKVVAPQIMYLISLQKNSLLWVGFLGGILGTLMIIYRRLTVFYSDEKQRRRRYFLYRLGNVFARSTQIIGFATSTIYLIFCWSMMTCCFNKLFPSAYQFQLGSWQLDPFVVHLQSNLSIIVLKSDSRLVLPLTTEASILNYILPVLCMVLIGITYCELTHLSPKREDITLRKFDLSGMNITSQSDVEAATLLIIEELTGYRPAKLDDDLFEIMGVDALGYVEIECCVEELFEIRPTGKLAGPISKTPKELAERVLIQLRARSLSRQVPDVPDSTFWIWKLPGN